MSRRLLTALVAVLLAGCAGTSPATRLARGGMPEALCVHCNCLMPAGIDPNAMCPVCECGKTAHQCVRGE